MRRTPESLRAPEPHTFRGRLKNVLLLSALSSSVAATSGCNASVPVNIIDTMVAADQSTDYQEDMVFGGADMVGIKIHKAQGREKSRSKKIVDLIVTRQESSFVAGQTISGEKCYKSAIITDFSHIPTECEPGDEGCHKIDKVVAAHEFGHMFGLKHSCNCYVDECPDIYGLKAMCEEADDDCNSKIDECFKCDEYAEEDQDPCDAEDDFNIMNGSTVSILSNELTREQEDTVEELVRKFNSCTSRQ